MTTVNWTLDQQVSGPAGKYGRKQSRVSSGPNNGPGDLVPHSYSCTITDETRGYRGTWRCCPVQWSPSTWLPYCNLERAWTPADDYALFGDLEKTYDQDNGFNAGVFIGELGKTVDTIASRAHQLFQVARSVKHGQFRKAAQQIRRFNGSKKRTPKSLRKLEGQTDYQTVSGAWLEFQYGWKPMLSDIYTMAGLIPTLDKPRVQRVSVRRKIRFYPGDSDPAHKTVGGGVFSKQIIAYFTEQREPLASSLGLLNPELVAWELVPFSFVADWFIPIGSYLQARAFRSRAVGTFVTTEFTQWRAYQGEAKRVCNGSNCGYAQTYVTAKNIYVKVARTVSTTLPSVPLPTFSNGLGRGSRLANATALLASLFLEKSRG